ncbi:hypothetical protein RFI_20993 [Reticulomyxa filosa]|uniref:Uncharacterized protein n=1 Tax=Reticulomyxa filosa TaxID=46433 RepID=X6MRE0_RETFI|nr:hypothetical protein RFI_20993 [Reticulomyxa filosa]|eukprot:ETO16359.1 hypothetical protein RFI_20993 [Reticulomyxa filosa]
MSAGGHKSRPSSTSNSNMFHNVNLSHTFNTVNDAIEGTELLEHDKMLVRVIARYTVLECIAIVVTFLLFIILGVLVNVNIPTVSHAFQIGLLCTCFTALINSYCIYFSFTKFEPFLNPSLRWCSYDRLCHHCQVTLERYYETNTKTKMLFIGFQKQLENHIHANKSINGPDEIPKHEKQPIQENIEIVSMSPSTSMERGVYIESRQDDLQLTEKVETDQRQLEETKLLDEVNFCVLYKLASKMSQPFVSVLSTTLAKQKTKKGKITRFCGLAIIEEQKIELYHRVLKTFIQVEQKY